LEDTAAIAKPKGQYHHGDLRSALLRATEQLVSEKGTGAVSLREVARIAGVSHGAPAHHFVNKTGLLLAFAQEGWDRMIAAISDGIDTHTPTNGPELLETVGQAYVDFAVENPGQFEVMFRRDLYDTKDTGYVGAGESAWVFLSDTIQQCIDEGFAESEDAEPFTVIAWSMVHGLAALWNSGRVKSRFERLEIARLNGEANRRLTDLMFDRPARRAIS